LLCSYLHFSRLPNVITILSLHQSLQDMQTFCSTQKETKSEILMFLPTSSPANPLIHPRHPPGGSFLCGACSCRYEQDSQRPRIELTYLSAQWGERERERERERASARDRERLGSKRRGQLRNLTSYNDFVLIKMVFA